MVAAGGGGSGGGGCGESDWSDSSAATVTKVRAFFYISPSMTDPSHGDGNGPNQEVKAVKCLC